MEAKEFPIEEELKKEPKVSPDHVALIRQWLKTQPHLPEKYITDLDIVLAYRCCNYSIEVAKQVIDLNYSLRTLITPFFKDRKFDAATEATFRKQLFVALPSRSKEGNVVFYMHGLNTDPSVFDCSEYIRAFFMTVDLWQYENGSAPGFEMVIDFEGYTTSHVPKIDIRNGQNFMYYVQEAIPLKLKYIHVMNSPSFLDTLFTVMKPFIKKEIFKMIKTHPEGFNSIKHIVDMEAFPKDVGGNYKTFEELTDETIKKLRASNSFFENENKKRVVESLRPGKPKNYSDVFGCVEGSFKKLEVD